MSEEDRKLYNQLQSLLPLAYAKDDLINQLNKRPRFLQAMIVLVGYALFYLNILISGVIVSLITGTPLMDVEFSNDSHQFLTGLIWILTQAAFAAFGAHKIYKYLYSKKIDKYYQKVYEEQNKLPKWMVDGIIKDDKYISVDAINYMCNDLETARVHGINELLDRYDQHMNQINVSKSLQQRNELIKQQNKTLDRLEKNTRWRW